MTELHKKYAPILHFNKDERFYPMQADDMLTYSGLYTKGNDKPLVPAGQLTIDKLAKHSASAEVFVRSVTKGPFDAADVVSEWGEGTLEMVMRWAEETRSSWTDDLARKAYSWFSPKTQPATHLFWWNSMISSLVGGAVQSISSNELPRLTLPAETRTNAVERYQAKKPRYAYYHRQVKDGNYLSLQYWFFYSYNDWGRGYLGFNDHEGDWESMHLFFRLDRHGRPQEPPAYVTYANHESRITKPWNHRKITRVGNHPAGFVAAGSHATYPEKTTYSILEAYDLNDYATGDGKTIDHDDWSYRINLDDVPWLVAYKGSWGTRFWLSTTKAKALLQIALGATPLSGIIGLTYKPQEIEVPGVSAPRGPVGKERPQYASPVEWAGIKD